MNRPGGARNHLADGLAIGLIAVALLSTYGGVWHEGISQVVPAKVEAASERRQGLREVDQRIQIWSVARTARVLMSDPASFYDAEACYPAANPMGLGHSLTSLGILGIPAWLLSGDPIVTYNMALFIMSAMMAVAMYCLVREWTASRPAALAAALLFAFHPTIALQLTHPYVNDLGWMVLALLFARRFFESARLRDALSAGVLCALQAISNPYSAYASIFIGIPMLLWMLRHYGARRELLLPGLAAAGCMTLLALLALYPYIAVQTSTGILQRKFTAFTSWSTLLPRPGLLMLALALTGLIAGRDRVLAGLARSGRSDGKLPDPRWMLVLALVLLVGVVTGGNVMARMSAIREGTPIPMALPNLFEVFAVVIPGMDAVRVITYLYPGIHLCLALLAGLGAAAALSYAPERWRVNAGLALVALVFGATLQPSWLGLGPRRPESSFRARPDPADLEFFEALSAEGNSGPILELPMGSKFRSKSNSYEVLLSAYHERHTSSCQASFRPQAVLDLQRLSRRLHEPGALDALRELGFTTIIVHTRQRTPARRAMLERLKALASDPKNALRPLLAQERIAAFALEAPTTTPRAGGAGSAH